LDAESTTEAVRCFAAGDALRSAIGLATRPVDETERAKSIALAREVLGPEAFEQHWTAAAALSLSEMIEYVSRARGDRTRPASGLYRTPCARRGDSRRGSESPGRCNPAPRKRR